MSRVIVENAWVEFPVRISAEMSDIGGAGGVIDVKRGVVSAVRDVSFELREGDRLGLMGHNGAGKTTLLRMLCGAYPPTKGRVILAGKVSTLFNTTPGLSTDGTGRENLMTCGLHLGMSRREIAAKMDEIVAFAELGPFIDLPVRIYSAGMKTRLGFAIATAVEPEILLLDEGLATGDAHFARKAQQKIQELITRSSILVVASHSEALLKTLCTRCLRLEHGKVVAEGSVTDLFRNYVRSTVETAQSNDAKGLEAAYRLATQMSREGQKPPPELEELGLRHALSISPEDRMMLQRYVHLLRQQGKPVPPETEVRLYVAILEKQPDRMDVRHNLQRIVAARPDEIPEALRDRAAIFAGAQERST